MSRAYPRLLRLLETQAETWTTFVRFPIVPEAVCERLVAMLRLFILSIAVELNPFFVSHHSALEEGGGEVWQVLEEPRHGVCFHFLIHKSGVDAYALDFVQWRTEECPYGVRLCGWEKH